MCADIVEKLNAAGITYLCDVSMAEKTWIHRGPVCPLYITPKNADELEYVVRLLYGGGVLFKIVGYTSNIYMLPTYKVDVIVSTVKMKSFDLDGNMLICEAGVNISRIALWTVNQGYEGFEGFVGLPGTVGAAVVNNAGCYKCVASEHLEEAVILFLEGGNVIKQTVGTDFFEFSHRQSSLKIELKNAVILSLTFRLRKTEDAERLKKTLEYNIWHRKTFQEIKKNNLGSIYSWRRHRYYGLKGIILKISGHLFNPGKNIALCLKLYGYTDLRPYISRKDDNCFIWKDASADVKFIQYQEFMHKSCELGKMEIEILK